MKMGKGKCAYINIEKGKKVSLGKTFKMHETEMTELTEGENYTYLRQDEDVGYNDSLNKERVASEYFKRVRKIWKSELYSHHKINAHNTFAIPVIIPTFGILQWTKEEIEKIVVKTRKILCLNGTFHVNSDVDRLYSPQELTHTHTKHTCTHTYHYQIILFSLPYFSQKIILVLLSYIFVSWPLINSIPTFPFVRLGRLPTLH